MSGGAWINEFHHDDTSGEVGEFVEIAGPAGLDLAGWRLVFYNGSGGGSYGSAVIGSVMLGDETGTGFGFYSFDFPGIQNGGLDGLALFDADENLVEFLSYQGSITAKYDTLTGVTSTDIGVNETGDTPAGLWPQRVGTGTEAADFTWTLPQSASRDAADTGQTFGALSTAAFSIADVSIEEGTGSTTIANFDISLSEPISSEQVSLDYETSDGTATGGEDYTPTSGTVTFVASGPTTLSIPVEIGADATPEGDETFFVTLSNIQGNDGEFIDDGEATGTILNDDVAPITPISAVQGTGLASGLVGADVTVEGIVVGLFTDGFFLQEEDGDSDSDPATSEGIFVYTSSSPSVIEGDKVRVTGSVNEFFGMTQIDNDNGTFDVTRISSGNLSLVTPTPIDLPTSGDTRAEATFEGFEGMLVRFADTLYVSEYFDLGRYGQIILTEGGRPFQYTEIHDPSNTTAYDAYQADLASRRIILDDLNNRQNAPLSDGVGKVFHPAPDGFAVDNFFRGGDTVTDLTGVLHWSWAGQGGTDAWRVRPTGSTPVVFDSANTRPADAPDVGGSLKVASLNVSNYFATIDTTSSNNSGTAGPSGTLDARGADSAAEFVRQTDKIIAAMDKIDADILGLIELENDTGASIQNLVNALNAVSDRTYDYIDTGFVGEDAIKQGFIYDTLTVSPTGAAAIFDTDAFLDPNGFGSAYNRPAIAQTFTEIASDESFTAAVNHLKSKGSPVGPGDDDPIQGNGNGTRTAGLTELVAWLETDPTGSGDDDIMILGDLNAYAMEDPVQVLLGAGYVDLVTRFQTDPYSYLFDGQIGRLDYIFANALLATQVAGADIWNINADEVPLLDYNDTINDQGEASFEAKPDGNPLYAADAFRSSDHDPVIAGFELNGGKVVSGRPGGSGAINGTNGNDILVSGGGRQVLMKGLDGDDIFRFVDTEGLTDVLTINDYTPGQDQVDLNGEVIASIESFGKHLRLVLEGPDMDEIILQRIDSIDDVDFYDSPFMV